MNAQQDGASRAWFWTGAFAVALIAIAASLPALGLDGRSPTILGGMCIGLAIAGVGLQAAACALSQGPLHLRVATSLAAGILAYCFLRQFFEDRDISEFGGDLAGQWVLLIIVCLVLRWRGFELRRVSALPRAAGPVGAQFSLGRLLVFTSACAVMFGLGSQMRLRGDASLLFSTIVATAFACTTLLPLVACLMVPHVVFYGALALLAAGGIATVFAQMGNRLSVFGLSLMATIFLWPAPSSRLPACTCGGGNGDWLAGPQPPSFKSRPRLRPSSRCSSDHRYLRSAKKPLPARSLSGPAA